MPRRHRPSPTALAGKARRLPAHAARAALLPDHPRLIRRDAGDASCCSPARLRSVGGVAARRPWSPAWRAACRAPSRRWTGAPSCAAPASASASASPPSQLTLVRKAQAADGQPAAVGAGKIEVKRTVCGHCSVGCAIDAVVENGVWVRQEPVFDSPINLGAHCAKGAALREHGHGEYRLQLPDEAGRRQVPAHQLGPGARRDQRQDARAAQGRAAPIRSSSSARRKHNNEQAYLLRKWVSLWGSNNCDHQARICHSTTVAGVANTWGYGAMTNSYNDMQNSQGGAVHRLERGRGASGVDAAHAACQGKRLQDDRGRPALHAHGGQGRRVRAHPLGLRHPVPVRRAAPHLQERLGRQEVHQRPRLRHGQGARGRAGQVDARQGAGGLRRRRGARCCKVAKTMAENRPEHHRLVHGPDAAHHRQRDGARLVHPAAGARQHRRVAAAAPTSSAATTTCRAPPTSAPTPIRCPATTAWPKARGSTSPRSGASTSSGSRSSTRPA